MIASRIMFSLDQYELLDFGRGRKLERFGSLVLDRPAPVAARAKKDRPALWKSAHGRYQRRDSQQGRWRECEELPEAWTVRHESLVLELKRCHSGAIGLYPEQAKNWDWLAAMVRRADRPPRVLNLFAHTGGSTLAVAAAGAQVIHVDAARNVVAWARRCARRSRLQDAPIRWIVEDAAKFVKREEKRGQRYDAIILDPPTYGHGPKGEPWKIDHHLMPLLRCCGRLLAKQPCFLLLTCHAPRLEPADLQAMLADTVFGHCQSGVRSRSLTLATATGRVLRCGNAAFWAS